MQQDEERQPEQLRMLEQAWLSPLFGNGILYPIPSPPAVDGARCSRRGPRSGRELVSAPAVFLQTRRCSVSGHGCSFSDVLVIAASGRYIIRWRSTRDRVADGRSQSKADLSIRRTARIPRAAARNRTSPHCDMGSAAWMVEQVRNSGSRSAISQLDCHMYSGDSSAWQTTCTTAAISSSCSKLVQRFRGPTRLRSCAM